MEEATAAIVAAPPSGRAARLRGLDARVQQPGNDAACGEVPGPDGGPAGTHGRSVFAARGATEGCCAFSS